MVKAFISQHELAVLKTLSERLEHNKQRPVTEIAEISAASGIHNSEEVQRALFILEGKNLVEPEPRGDLTSSNWQITETGVMALQMISS